MIWLSTATGIVYLILALVHAAPIPCLCFRRIAAGLRDCVVVADILALHKASVLNGEFAYTYLLWLNQRHDALGCGKQVSILVGMCFGQQFLEGFLISFRIGLMLVDDDLSLGFLCEETAQQCFRPA